MATTFVDYTGDGNATKTFSFPSYKVEDIKVKVDDVVKTVSTHYNITSYTTTGGGNVVFTSGNIPASPADIHIYRDSDVESAKATYTAGSSVKAGDLNNNHTQLLYALQEEQNQLVRVGNIKDSAVTRDKIAADAVNGTKIADDSINSEHYVDGSIDTAHIADSQITSAKIADGTIQTADIAADQITAALIADDQINSEHYASVSIDTEHIANENITTAKLANSSVTAAKIADGAITSSKLVGLTIDTGSIADGNITTVKIADLNVTRGKLEADAVDGSKLADNAVDSEHYVDGSIDRVHLEADIIDSTKLADNSVNSEHYVDASINHIHLGNDLIDGDNIQDSVINSEHYVDGSIDREHLAADIVDSTKIADDAVGAEHIQANAVTDSEIATGTLDNRYFTETELTGGALDGRYFTETESDARYFNITSGETIKDGDTFPDNDTTIATTAAINDRIIDIVNDVGGFDIVESEQHFPNTNPQGQAGSAAVLSIKAASGNLVPSGTTVTVTNGNLADNADITITGVTATIPTGFGFIVESTNTLHTYTFHRLVPKATEVTTVAGNTTNITAVANNASNINSAVSNASNINSAVSNASNINTVAGISSNVTSVANNASNINAAVSNASNINSAVSNASNITAAVTNASNINAAVANTTNINSAVSNQNDITAIATNIANVNTVATNITNVSNVSSSAGANQTFTVTVPVTTSKYYIDGAETPVLKLARGKTYTFDLADSTNSSHPFAFRDSSDNSYTTGVTTSGTAGNAGATVIIVVAANAPSSLKYYCTTHGNSMGNTITVIDDNVGTVAGSIGNVNTVAGAISNVNTTATNIASINNASANISSVNNFGDKYQVASSNPSTDGGGNALAEGDLYFNTTANELKVYNGGAWQGGVTASGSFASTTGNSFSGDNTYVDNAKARFGTGQDLEIFHNASDSIINDTGTGSLKLQTGGNTKIEITSTGTSVTGNIVVSGNVDGRDVAADGTKLDGIESSATADQTAAEIRTLVESASDSNVFTDADHTKLNGIEASATADQTNAEIRAAVEAASDSNVFTDADHSKLNGIESGATGDQTASEVLTLLSNQNITTTGITTTSKVTINSTSPSLEFEESDGNPDYRIISESGELLFQDTDAGPATRLKINTDGHIDVAGNLDVGAGIDVTGNITVSGTVDGRDVATDGTKLDGVAASANNYSISSDLLDEDNMASNSATKVASQQSIKAYVDAEVAGVVDSAPGALNTLNELAAALGDDASFSTTVTNSIATKLPLAGGTMTGNIVMSGSQTVDGRDLSADGSKLDGIESGATGDQTNAEIRTAVHNASDSNVFTDADHSKLNGIAASATNVTNNNQLTNGAGYTTYTSNQATNTSSNVTFGTINCSSLTASGNVTAYSDARLKTDISTINDALSIVGKLRGVSYKWLRSGQNDIGVIAQEVEEVIPEIVKTSEVLGLDGIEEVKSVDYGRLVGVLINAVNELKAELDAHKAEVAGHHGGK